MKEGIPTHVKASTLLVPAIESARDHNICLKRSYLSIIRNLSSHQIFYSIMIFHSFFLVLYPSAPHLFP